MTFTSYLLSAAVLSTLISTTSASPVVARSLAAPAIPADISDYAGRSVWRFSRTAIDGVDDVVSELLEFAKSSHLDVWRASPLQVDLLFSDDRSRLDFVSQLNSSTWSASAMIPDVGELLLSQMTSSSYLPPSSGDWDLSTIDSTFHQAYHPFTAIEAFVDELARTFPEIVETFEIGKSAEGRSIKAMRITTRRQPASPSEPGPEPAPEDPTPPPSPPSELADEAWSIASAATDMLPVASWRDWLRSLQHSFKSKKERRKHKHGGKKDKRRRKHHKGKHGKSKPGKTRPTGPPPEIYIQAGQHAREWIAPATVLYFAHHLATQAEDDSTIAHLLDAFAFVIVPSVNPDGYEYSRNERRMWRKNRQSLSGDDSECKGIDMNANWGYRWDAPIHQDPCSESYPGSRAFEAKENELVAEYLKNKTVKAFVDVHSYGQLFMFPYSYSCSDSPKDAEVLMEAGLGVAKAIRDSHGTSYLTGQACDLVYRMAGDAIDYAYGHAGIRWSWSAELRDTGTYGFLLPASLIRPTAAELTDGLVYLANFIEKTEMAK